MTRVPASGGTKTSRNLDNFPRFLHFSMDTLKDSSIQQFSCLTGLVHTYAQDLIAEVLLTGIALLCKKHMECLPFRGECLFGPTLDDYIQKLTMCKSTLLTVKRRLSLWFKNLLLFLLPGSIYFANLRPRGISLNLSPNSSRNHGLQSPLSQRASSLYN